MLSPRPVVPSWGGEEGTPVTSRTASPSTTRDGGGRRLIFIIAALVVAVGGAVLVWTMLSRGSEGQSQATGQQQGGQQGAANQPTPPTGMVYVPGGEFTMGRNDGDEYERPAHKVTVKPFFIDAHEVTCREYKPFLQNNPNATGHCANYDSQEPVTDMNWDDAVAYAKWSGKRLPTEEEWELAARGTDGRLYPWGNEWKGGMANADAAGGAVTAAGKAKGASPYGAFDMVGNVWEWTASPLKAYTGGRIPQQTPGELRVIRGGSYAESRNEATTTYRRGYPARGNYDYGNTGFRCAKDVGGASQ